MMKEEQIKTALIEDWQYAEKHGTEGTRFNFTN